MIINSLWFAHILHTSCSKSPAPAGELEYIGHCSKCPSTVADATRYNIPFCCSSGHKQSLWYYCKLMQIINKHGPRIIQLVCRLLDALLSANHHHPLFYEVQQAQPRNKPPLFRFLDSHSFIMSPPDCTWDSVALGFNCNLIGIVAHNFLFEH